MIDWKNFRSIRFRRRHNTAINRTSLPHRQKPTLRCDHEVSGDHAVIGVTDREGVGRNCGQRVTGPDLVDAQQRHFGGEGIAPTGSN